MRTFSIYTRSSVSAYSVAKTSLEANYNSIPKHLL